VTSFERKSPGSGCRRPKTGVYCAFDFLQGCSSQKEAVAWQESTSRELRWSEGRLFTGSHLEVGVEGRKLTCTVRLTSYKAVARRRQSRDRKLCHLTSGNLRDPKVTSFDRKSPGSGCRRSKTCIYCAFNFLQGCCLQEEAVTWQEMTSRDLRWPEVTRKWCHLTGSDLEVAVEGRKLVYTVHLTSYKAVARRRRQSLDRKWQVTLGDRKWPRSDLTGIIWKWL